MALYLWNGPNGEGGDHTLSGCLPGGVIELAPEFAAKVRRQQGAASLVEVAPSVEAAIEAAPDAEAQPKRRGRKPKAVEPESQEEPESAPEDAAE